MGSDRADFTGSNINQAVFGDRSHAQMVNQYFNTALFTVNAVGTYGAGFLTGPLSTSALNTSADIRFT